MKLNLFGKYTQLVNGYKIDKGWTLGKKYYMRSRQNILYLLLFAKIRNKGKMK